MILVERLPPAAVERLARGVDGRAEILLDVAGGDLLVVDGGEHARPLGGGRRRSDFRRRHLDLRRGAQTVGERLRRFLLPLLAQVSGDLVFDLLELALNLRPVRVVERLGFRVGERRRFRVHFAVKQFRRRDAAPLRFGIEQLRVNLALEFALSGRNHSGLKLASFVF